MGGLEALSPKFIGRWWKVGDTLTATAKDENGGNVAGATLTDYKWYVVADKNADVSALTPDSEASEFPITVTIHTLSNRSVGKSQIFAIPDIVGD